jgi:hypothetical protein
MPSELYATSNPRLRSLIGKCVKVNESLNKCSSGTNNDYIVNIYQHENLNTTLIEDEHGCISLGRHIAKLKKTSTQRSIPSSRGLLQT